ncbi:MAG TPA: hypothetical protein VI479_20360 [Blastocatellia bacterium]
MQEVNAPSVRWEWISEAWEQFTRQWSVWVLMILVTFLIGMAVYLPFVGIIGMMMPAPEIGEPFEFPVGIFALYPIMYLAILGVASWLTGGLYNAAFKQVRGEQIAIGDLFSGGRYFTRILGAYILIAIGVGIGSLLCFIPGLLVAGLSFLTLPIIVGGDKGTIDAIKASIEVTKKDWIMFTFFAIALGLISGAGVIACGVGVLATYPLFFLGHALAYRDLVGISGAQAQGQFMSPPSPPDYRSYTPSQAPAAPDYSSYAPPPPSPSTPSQPQSWEAPTYVSPAAPETPSMTCPHCGAVLARVLNFCNQCGRPLRSA